MKNALGLAGLEGFPFQLSALKTKIALPIPAVEFTESAPSIAKIFNKGNRIYATPDEFFVAKFRNIFQQARLTHTASAEAKTWLRGPNMGYWPQQLNFAMFCATQGCGISREIFHSGLSLTPQIRAFYQFHVYFTVRRVLYQLGGIQSMSALPWTPRSINLTTFMTWPRTKEYAQSSGLIHRAIFALQSEKTTGLEIYTSILKAQRKQNTAIQTG